MKITMINTSRGSENGHTVHQYHKGIQYDVADTLAKCFLKEGAAYNSEPLPELPASPSAFERIMYDMAMAHHEFNKKFRVPTNPATYKAIGESL